MTDMIVWHLGSQLRLRRSQNRKFGLFATSNSGLTVVHTGAQFHGSAGSANYNFAARPGTTVQANKLIMLWNLILV